MLYPNNLQSALLYDAPVTCLDAVVRDFQRLMMAQTGHPLNPVEVNPGIFYRLFGAGEMMVTLEFVNNPPDFATFRAPMASEFLLRMFPNMVAQLSGVRTMVLINVSHGVLGGVDQMAQFASLFENAGIRREGASLPEFTARLKMLGLLSRMVIDHAKPVAVHWTQSDQILLPEVFENLAALDDAPGILHVHPFLYGGEQAADGNYLVGIRTFGARHFIGREIVIEPHITNIAFHFPVITAFLKVATMDNGYIIPDGHSFGPDDGSFSYNIRHVEVKDGDVPTIEMTPLMIRQYNYQSPDYIPKDRVFNDQAPPPSIMPPDEESKQNLVNHWREHRKVAQRAGNNFEVRASEDLGPILPNDPSARGSVTNGMARGPFGARAVFGRKR